MITESMCPCELIIKIGSNECEEISNALTNLLRLCSIANEKFLIIDRQIHPTNYFGSFTHTSSISPISCQSISCVLFLPQQFFDEYQKKNHFKSIHFWKFHHKIELLNEYQEILARQDYYELSQYLPLWSIAQIPLNKQIIIRMNIFTKNFDSMCRFYQHLFQRKPDSSKSGFVLFYLSSNRNGQIIYQLSLKSSPSIQSYPISQNTCLKIHLIHPHHFLRQYSSKLFTINPYEYYVYDPDGNLLHLYLHPHVKSSKMIIQTNDSGFGDSSQSDHPFLHSNLSRIITSMDNQSYSSNDSGQCTSISSNEFHPKTHIAVRAAKPSEINDRLKLVSSLIFPNRSVYESEPRLSHSITSQNRSYSSMNNLRRSSPPWQNNNDDDDSEISYEVDSPTSNSYLQRFLWKKQHVTHPLRPKSAPLGDLSSIRKSFDSRINIGITLDSRLRKTPVFDMLRSTMMESPRSMKNSFIARF